MSTGQAALQNMQQIWQFDQLVIQQMQTTGVDTSGYTLNVPPWSAWEIGTAGGLSLSVKSGPAKRGTQVRIKWRGGDYAAVYYTLDGWTPTPASTRYTKPIIINRTARLQAIGIGWNCLTNYVCKGWKRSAITTAKYEVTPDPKPPNNSVVAPDGMLRAGTMLKLKTTSETRSSVSKPGDKISLSPDQDVYTSATIAIPKGTPVDTVLTMVARPLGPHRLGLLILEVQGIQSSRNTIKLTGTEAMEGETGKDAIIEPGLTLYAKVASDARLQP